ncbi:hypothetical protein HanOQP8_Chr15g0558941 [Helianthus annuus]|nr:hypothetical protein HanOQP8_Chr15g0558941 [Helianthus annuus]
MYSAPFNLSSTTTSDQLSTSSLYLLNTPLDSSTTYIVASSIAATGPLQPPNIPTGISAHSSESRL